MATAKERFEKLLTQMESETIERCTDQYFVGHCNDPTAVCIAGWFGLISDHPIEDFEDNEIDNAITQNMRELLQSTADGARVFPTQIHELNDDNPNASWKEIARKLRRLILPNIPEVYV